MGVIEKKENVLLFLGFEGVTHPVAHCKPFQSDCLYWLNKLLKRNTCIDVVLSSSLGEQYSRADIKNKLGVAIETRVVGVASKPDDQHNDIKMLSEIQQYLKSTSQEERKWIAIDHGFSVYNEKLPIVLTNPKVGFSEDDYFNVVKKLLIVLLGMKYQI